ncbi:SRPBCC family protein [Aeoliella sp. SH292]|uniref:SRPBCC family protein n=1 Tax=Aeoliella sp. SH292 TaxID=3454464 RepID=UPI003F999429
MARSEKPNELRLVRVYDAPVQMVWDAWTDPEQVGQWWGPRGFTITTHDKDFRTGGFWRYTMHGPDGTDYPNHTVYLEIDEHRKLVYDHGGYDDRPPLFRVTVLFSEADGRTTMDMTMALATPEAAKEIAKFIKQAGGNATWDRLAEHLANRREGVERFVIHRTFDATVEQVFDMWTDPAHLAQWLPPAGFKMELLRGDIQPGGSTFFRMFNDADMTLHGRCEYLEINPPSRIVYTQQFCDAEEKLCHHPMAPVWPSTMLTTVELTAEGADQTRVTVTSEAIGEVTSDELAAFAAERSGMTAGWTGSFDQLEELLANG